MTQEYKDFILDYLAGNKTDTPMVNQPILEQATAIENDLKTYIQNIGGSTSWGYTGILQPTNSDKMLLYGNVSDGDSSYIPFIIVLDENFNILGHTTTYDSGTQLSSFMRLEFDENNKLYGIDNTTLTLDPQTSYNTYRFIMLDNPIMNYESTGSVSVRLRRSYYFPSAYNSGTSYGYQITKNPNTSKYLMVTTIENNNVPIVRCILLEVNVGSTNTWNNYESSQMTSISSVQDIFADWSGEQVKAKIYSGDYVFELSNGSISRTQVVNNTLPGYTGVQSVVALNYTTAYYGMVFYPSNSYASMQARIYKYDGTNLTKIWNSEYVTAYGVPPQVIRLQYKDGLVFYNRYEKIDFSSGSPSHAKTYTGVVYNDEVYEIQTNSSVEISGLGLPIIRHNYNLWRIGYQETEKCYITQMVFNVDNYNGESGIDINSGVPHSMRLYGSDGILFARNLYNMRINENTITSIMEVPNTYLNDTTITNEDLYSVNNNIIDQHTDSINTNIFETLYINVNDTWNMINRNDPLEPLTNKTGATRVVNSTASQVDYDNAKVGVFRVVTSGGYYDRYINASDISYDNGVYTYSFNFYGNPSINQIQILSYDKQTIYCTYDISTQSGKTYTYTQELTIE